MNIRVVEYSIFVISAIYSIIQCRDLRHTNDLQDVALGEINKSLSLLMKTNIDSYHSNNSNKIELKSEKLNSKSIHKKNEVSHQDKNAKSMNLNGIVLRKASHINYDKHRYGHEVSMIPTHEYKRQNFDIVNRIKNKKKKTMKKLWTKQQSFPNNVRKAMNSQKSAANDSLMKSKLQEKGFEERKKQLDGNNVESRKLTDMDTGSSDVIPNIENDLSQTSCVLTKAEIIPPCGDSFTTCSDYAYSGDCTDYYWQEWMIENCQKSCDACPTPDSLLENQINIKEDRITVTNFNLSLNVNTDSYANDTSWTLMSQDRNDLIVSHKMNFTSKLENNTGYEFSYNCIISESRENQLTDDTTSTCYNFEVYDSHGDGMCCEYGGGLFSVNILIPTKLH